MKPTAPFPFSSPFGEASARPATSAPSPSQRAPMARRRMPSYDAQRALITERAAGLFGERGYSATTMNEVALACRLSKAGLYHYFRDKYDLLVFITDQHLSRLEAVVAEVGAQRLQPDERLRQLILRIVAEYADAQHAHRVLTEDIKFLVDSDRERLHERERDIVNAFAEAVQALWPQLRPGLTKPLVMLLFGMVNWMFTWLRPDGALTHDDMGPMVADLFFGGVPNLLLTASPDDTSPEAAPRRAFPR